jgi:hypothetical protein
MSAINEKKDPAKTRSLEEEQIFLRGAIREAEEVLTLRSNPGWDRVQKSLTGRLERVEEELDKFDSIDDNQIRLLLKERKDWRFVLNLTAKLEDAIPQLHDQLAGVERKLAERNKTGERAHA